jgi:DNA helicase-2/ATP-dependent DNA helicase PcrA
LLLGLKKDQVMQKKDYNKIGDHLGLRFNVDRFSSEVAPVGKNAGDQYAFIDGFSRSRKIEPLAVWDIMNHDGLNWYEFERYINTVADYKEMKNLTDFADMLSCRTEPLDLDVCIIDEAQDLSTAQWEFIQHTFQNTKRIYIAGDDDQAIFEWSGADVGKFVNLKGTRTILDQSYRVPKAVHSFAVGITSKIRDRVKKDYNPRGDNGCVEYWGDVDSIDMSSGTWLLLCRNGYLLSELGTVAKQGGYRYTLKGSDSVPKADVKAILLWEKYRGGLSLSDTEKGALSNYVDKFDTSKIWHEAFTKLPVEQLEYYVSLLRNGESLTKPARIALSTIHGSKGGEADHVVLMTDMAYSTWDAVSLNEDAEHRVWYVGATRAKQSLNIVMPRGRYFYQL